MDGPAAQSQSGQSTQGGSVEISSIGPSINDHQLFMQTHIPDLQQEVNDTQVFTWKIYDSKTATGYVGLRNQGATSYMNVLLQSLYCIPYFRKTIYGIPTENATPTESITLALQRIFYRLQTSQKSVSTTELTKSFGWKITDSFKQQDVYEFATVLLDKVERIIEETPVGGSIQYLFWGRLKSYIRCDNINFESSQLEDYNFLDLNVKGFRNLRESFREYITAETLDGDLRYSVPGHDPQIAKKGVELVSLPVVLCVRLKRYVYNARKDAMVKCNDRLEYPFEIDMEEFLGSDVDRSESHVYRLHTVMVHVGDLHGGTYYTFIKPNDQTRWLKFDDDRVTPATEKEVFEHNYGTLGAIQKFANAYVLLYIRKSRLSEILGPLTDEDVPSHLKRMLEEEERKAEQKKKEIEEQKRYLTITVVTEQNFRQHEGFDLVTFNNNRNYPPSELQTVRVLKEEQFSELKTQVAQQANVPLENMHLWSMIHRQNRTIRPEAPIKNDDSTMTVESVRDMLTAGSRELRFFVDVVPRDQLDHLLDGSMIILFLKYFDPNKQELRGVGRIHVPMESKIGDLSGLIHEKMGWSNENLNRFPLNFFEEIKPGMIEHIESNDATLAQCELQNGDILCFQVDMDPQEIASLEARGLASSPPKFYDILQNRIIIHFKPKNGTALGSPEFDLELSKKMTYEMMAYEISKHLDRDYRELRLTTTKNGQSRQVLRSSPNQVLSEILPSYGTAYEKPVILYEIVPRPEEQEPMSGPI
ncbi:cysteine proteinase [Serendipita vermifera]|nr:cysteine proteinase [Serendipita vermifera]